MVAPVVIAGGLQAAGSLLGGMLGSDAAEDAAKAQAQAQQQAAAQQMIAQQQLMRLQQPYMRMGNQALNTIASLYGMRPVAPTQRGYAAFSTPNYVKSNPLYALAYDQGGTSARPSPGSVLEDMGGQGQPGLTAQELRSVMPDMNAAQAREAVALFDKYGDRALTGILNQGVLGEDAKLGRNFEQVGNFAVARQRVGNEYDVAKGIGDGGAGAFFMSPEYKAQLQMGNQAMERQAAASGTQMSGQQLAAAQEFGQKIGSSAYSDWYNRLAGMAQMGPQAAGIQGAALQTGATNMGNLAIGGGQASAQGIMGQNNAWMNALNQGVGAFGAYQQNQADADFRNQYLGLLQGGGAAAGGGMPVAPASSYAPMSFNFSQ